ncbi:MAG: hypothetical protein HOQ43_10890 [Glycomyces artemisiae]|uniref:Uncharacterized protein n=1 Tax=Glycomyces artemisiae TaxID=1076443 RepID=A0A850CAV9_9ACTN|nr:hypothetical protein [Glycomyces artemisiae]
MRITAPNANYNGVGAGGVSFVDGVAELDTDKPAHRAALAYFRDAGYGIEGDEPVQPEGPPVQPDSREVGSEQTVGERLRDAAVDPQPEDFLPPTNAGEADPHGPLVVAPMVHASETGPIHPGDVHVDDPEQQQAQETALTEAVFVNGEDVTEATRAAAGEHDATKRPAQSAPKDEWVAFANHVDATAGVTEDHVEPSKLTKAQLIEQYGRD